MTFESIIGRKISTVALSPDRTRLTLTFGDGTDAEWYAFGDCCSQTWVEHLTVPPDVEGGIVTGTTLENDGRSWSYITGRPATEAEETESNAGREWPVEVLQVYQGSIATTRGEIIVEYRNDSNGYYGGSMDRLR